MAQPTPYTRFASFKSFQTLNPSSPLPGQSVDIEFNRVKTTLDELLTNLALIQRDDGRVANGTIGLAQLEPTLLAFNIDRPTSWLTSTAYVKDQTVFENSNLYICLVAHTSGTFATDLAAGKWGLIGDFSAIVSAAEDAAAAAAASATAASISETSASASATAADAAATSAGSGQLDWFGNLAGTNTYTCTNSTGYVPGIWTNGFRMRVRVVNSNTGAATINPNSWGAKSIVLPNGASLSGGELIAGSVVEMTYVSALDKCVLAGRALVDGAVTTAKLVDSSVTLTKIANIANDRILGNVSGTAGVVDELTPAEVTAFINPFTGDTGAGGVKGAVPAPVAGDAAAGKLKLLGAGAVWYRPSWHFIEELTGTGTELVTSADLAGYNLIKITAGVNPNVDDSFRLRIGTAGPSWITGVCDEYFVWNSHNVSTGAVNSGGDSAINGDFIDFREASFPIDASTNVGWVGEILIRNLSFARPKILCAEFNFLGTGNQMLVSSSFSGHIDSSAVATVVGFSFTGGASFDSSSGILIEGRKFG